MVAGAVSDGVLRFVQDCQVAVCVCGEGDYIAQVIAIWNCLIRFPTGVPEDDLLAAVTAICLVANGYFFFSQKWTTRTEGCSSSSRALVNTLLRLAQQRYADPTLTLRQLAHELHVSQEHLSRVLAVETQRSFRSAFRMHLNGIRLLAAIVKLQSRDVPIRHIAIEVGYLDNKELDRQFDRWFAITPRRFRALIAHIPPECLRVRVA